MEKDFNRKLIKVAAPIAVQGVVTATLTMIDNLMVGFLGETELAAVGVGSQLFMLHFMVLFGLLSGCATFIAQFYGTRDMANIRKVIGFAFTLLAILGLFCFALTNFLTDQILSIYTSDPAVRSLASTYVRIGSLSFLLLDKIFLLTPLTMPALTLYAVLAALGGSLIWLCDRLLRIVRR